MDTDFSNVGALEKQFDNTIGGRFTKRVKQKSTDSTTKDIVYGIMVVSLVFPIMMAVFLVMTLQDIDHGESRESCTAPFFTNPGQTSESKVQPTNSQGNNVPLVNVGPAFETMAKLPGGRTVPLRAYPCIDKN
jgi:hypothetical protein